MGNIFRFKRFEVDQHGCAMKINTDGVILGALSSFSADNSGFRALDIGTGTGVIAMMLAQRFEDAVIDAVEIEPVAAVAAEKNFLNSVFSERLRVFNSDIASFTSPYKYNLIVSNPPFFVNDLKSFESKKSVARHAGESFFETLVIKSVELLNDSGVLWLILPVKQADLVITLGKHHGLYLNCAYNIQSDINKPVIRKVISLSRHFKKVREGSFYIYESEKVYTKEYKALLKDFFLAF